MQSKKRRSFEVLSFSLLAGLAAAIAALFFFAWLAEEIPEGEVVRFDEATRAGLHQFASPTLTAAMRAASFLGSSLFLTVLGAGLVLCFLLIHWRRAAVLLALTMGGASLLEVTLKYAFHRARPVPFFNIIAPNSYSFPSGHALFSFCFYGALAAILAARVRSHRLRIIIWLTASLLILLVGISRIYLGVHYTTDILAGFAAALIWILVVALGDRWLRSRKTAAPD